MSWPTVELQELALQQKGAIVSGPFGSNIGSRFFVEQGVPVIRGNNLTKGDCKFIDDGFVYLTDSKASEFPNCIAVADDIVFTAAGSIGQVGLIPIDTRYERYVISNKQMRVRFDKEKADPLFVYYWLTSKRMTQYLVGMNNGGAVPLLNLGIIRRVPVPHPKLEIQKRIANILSAYDDLIENNRRRIQLLEQAARLLYKEWFVHLRFPGHEHVKIKDGIPDGWEKVSISSLCIVGRGGSPRPIKNFFGGTVPWFKIGDATASKSPFVFSTAEKIVEDGVKKSVLLQPIELILSNSATCGIPYFTGITGCIHDGWLYFKELKRISKWLLYCCLFEKQREILAGIGDGATQKNLNTDYIGRQILLLPKDKGLLSTFDDITEPIFSQIFTLSEANNKLANARDLLLPRLMNGEVAV